MMAGWPRTGTWSVRLQGPSSPKKVSHHQCPLPVTRRGLTVHWPVLPELLLNHLGGKVCPERSWLMACQAEGRLQGRSGAMALSCSPSRLTTGLGSGHLGASELEGKCHPLDCAFPPGLKLYSPCSASRCSLLRAWLGLSWAGTEPALHLLPSLTTASAMMPPSLFLR